MEVIEEDMIHSLHYGDCLFYLSQHKFFLLVLSSDER